MKTRILGNSDLHISTIGFGAWAIGGDAWAYGWGPQNDADSVAAIHAALNVGINWIDTAALYGLGHSEEVVAQALKGIRQRPYVFTKCARIWNERGEIRGCLTRSSIRRECDDSLQRLRVEAIDLYQIHRPIPDEDLEEGWAILNELRQEGKVRHIGVSNFTVAQMKRAQKIAPITSIQPSYSLVDPQIEQDVLPFCVAENIGVIVYSPMASGLLAGSMSRERVAKFPPTDFRRNHDAFQEPSLSHWLDLVELLRIIGREHERTPGEVATAWTLRQSGVTGAIVGLRNPQQVREIIGAAELRLTSFDLQRIVEFCGNRADGHPS